MNNLMIFNNEQFGEIRVITKDGEPYFIGKDVAEKLGYANLSDALSKHVDEEDKVQIAKHDLKNHKDIGTKGAIVINESGLYSLVLRSKLNSAKQFKRWVTGEVLPQIRKTGGYIQVEENMSDAEIMAKALLVAQKTIANKEMLLKQQAPKVEVFDRFIDKEHTLGFRELRKELEGSTGITIKEGDLKDILRDKKIIGKTIKASAYAIREGYAVTKDIEDKFGKTRTQDRFTMKCRDMILDYIENDFIVA